MRAWGWGLAAALAAGALLWWSARPAPIPVAVVAAERGDVERLVANTRAGTVEACRRARLSLPTGGQIAEVLVEEGQRVAAGQTLLRLWNADRRARLAEAEAVVATAEAQAQSRCLAAAADRREAQRLAALFARRLVAEEPLDRARTRAEAAAADCRAARAAAEQARAAVATARALLAQTELIAPFAGVVAELNAKAGEYSTPSPPGIPMPPAVDLLTPDCFYVSAPIDEVDAGEVRAGMAARVAIDAFPGRVFPARVRRVAPYVLDLEKQARTVEVEAEFAEPVEVALLAGLSADLEVVLEVRRDVVRLPTELLLEGGEVLVVGEDGRLERRRVEVGIGNWRYTEIRKGLAAGEAVVAEGAAAGLAEGTRVVVRGHAPR
ncbi:MAG: hypothetical protein KatS3mg124_0585 [Porticoccaceae bacterium]|nr:MAG: hypothetical protein KatS3mg124_0585 [Porticoccaceae bacterium]